MEKVVPTCGWLFRLDLPPWFSTMPCTMDSPRPVPLPSALVVKKGSKMRARCSGSMPGPCPSHLDHAALAVRAARSSASARAARASRGRRW